MEAQMNKMDTKTPLVSRLIHRLLLQFLRCDLLTVRGKKKKSNITIGILLVFKKYIKWEFPILIWVGWPSSISDLQRETGSTVLWNVSALRLNAGTRVTAGCSGPQECTLLTHCWISLTQFSRIFVRVQLPERREPINIPTQSSRLHGFMKVLLPDQCSKRMFSNISQRQGSKGQKQLQY